MGDVLKGFYYACEDKWYAGLDFLDKHGIPVYKIIDPIDQRIPSFALFSLLIILGLLFVIIPWGFFFQGPDVTVAFEVVDEESSPLPNIPISFNYLEIKDQVKTTNALGRIELTVPSGTTIHYSVDLEQYEIVKKSMLATTNTVEVIQLAALQTQNLSKTLKLVNEVGQPILANAQLTFTCSTTYGTPPSPITGNGGTFTVTPNADCIPLSVGIQVQGYRDVQSYPITADKDVYNIVMTPIQIKDASLIVTVVDTQNTPVPGLEVSIQTEGVIVENTLTDGGGIASFSVAAGEYVVVVSDPVQSLYTSVTDTVFVQSGETSTLTMIVSKNAANTIHVTVLDKKTNTPLKEANVKLKQGTTILQTVSTDNDGKASLPIADKTLSYQISASKSGYIPQQQTVSGATANVTFVLDKATGQNTAKLSVRIYDQDDEPVADAKVVLYDADSGFLAPYEAVVSDSNGIAKFNTVVSGNYKAFAYKAGLTGFSNEQFFDITDPTTYEFSIEMEIPDGTVSVHVVDKDGKPVPFAKVSVYNAYKNQLLGADLTDTNGTYVLPSNDQKSKADKDVYLIVSKAGYATVHTIQKPVIAETIQSFNVILPPTNPSGNIHIELTGLYTTDGKIVTGVGKGKDYIAKFRVDIPEEHDDLGELNVHVRTGEKDIVEKDEWYLKSINFPKTSVVKGSSWDPANGLNVDGDSITFGNAKWINTHMEGPQPGVYEFEATVHVRDTAPAQEILKLFYKAQTENGEVLRDPVDANPVDELYAATKQATYQVGVTTVCEGEFCFDASIMDEDNQIITDVLDQYNAQVFNDYTLTFNLLNNGSNFHTNSNIRIKSSSDILEFTTYQLFTADAQPLNGTVNDSEFKTPIVLGDFTPQKKIGGAIKFKPHAAGTALITMEIVSDFKPIYTKTLQITITGNKNMVVTVVPDTFPSNIPIVLDLHAEDEGTGDEIVGALVSLETNIGIVLATTFTDAAGNASIELPAQLPGKKITLKVQKPEYNPYVQVLEVSNKIITIAPEVLGVNINVKTELEKTKTFTITNETSLPIIISKMTIQGNLKGWLDKEKINSALLPYIGTEIAPKSMLEVQFKSVLTPEALQLQEHEDVDAVIGIEVQNYGNPWAFELPVKYSLAVANEVDDPTCFKALPNSWVTSTEGGQVTFEFKIQNNCSINGIPTTLKNMAVKANWNGNELGDTLLTIFEQNNPTALGGAHVRSGYFSPVLTNIPAEDVLLARLDFTPFAGIKGEGKFDVEIQAVNPLEGKPQILSTKINSAITIVNLADCILYDKEIIDITPGGKDSFTIETKNCGAPIQFNLISDVKLSSKDFTMQGSDKKQIEVLDDALDQGQYAITVKVEGNEAKVPSQSKVLRVRLTDPNACIQLNRYEFEVFDDPDNEFDGLDTARLDNYCVEQKVSVTIVIPKDFWESLKAGLIAGLVAGVVTLVNNLLSDDVDIWGNEKEPEIAPVTGGTGEQATDGTQAGGGTQQGTEGELVYDPATGTFSQVKSGAAGGTAGGSGMTKAGSIGSSGIQTPADWKQGWGGYTVTKDGETFFVDDTYGTVTNANGNIVGQAYVNNGAYTLGSIDGGASSPIITPKVEQYQGPGDVLSPFDQGAPAEPFSIKTLQNNTGTKYQVTNGDLTGFDDGTGYKVLHKEGTQYYYNKVVTEPPSWSNLWQGSTSVEKVYPDLSDYLFGNVYEPSGSTSGQVAAPVSEPASQFAENEISPATGLTTLPSKSPITGLAGAVVALDPQQKAQASQIGANPNAPQKKASGGSTVGSGILGGLSNIISLGSNNPLASFATVTIVYTLIDYLTSEDEEFDVTVTAKDVVVDGVQMIAGEKGATSSDKDSDIDVEESGAALNPKIGSDKASSAKVVSTNLTFTNASGFRDQTIFRNLLVSGTRFEYVQDLELEEDDLDDDDDGSWFDDDDEDEEKVSGLDESDLEVEEEEDVEVRFHLQFNSISPESLPEPPVTLDVLSCDTYSEKTGKTGKGAVPKVAFTWNFSDISTNTCDQGNVDTQGKANHVYCDATQFSIELIQKVQLLREFIEANAPFACPAEDLFSATKTQPVPAADIGISAIAVDKVNVSDTNIVVTITNNTPVVNHPKLTVEYKLENGTTTQTVTLTKDVTVSVGGSSATVGFVVPNLADGKYSLKGTIDPEECEDCSNSIPASDTIQTTFFIGPGSQVVDCEPFTTSRLDEFISATEKAGQAVIYPAGLTKEDVLGLVNFRTHLMQDRFSNDFHADFDRYARKISFFDAPTYYLNDTDGLHKFFTKPGKKWIVNREGNPISPEGYLIPGPGIYDVSIDINFDSMDMAFFQNGEPDAVIQIFLEKTSTIEDNSPFYSIPFNGLIGTDDGFGRVGYGINYAGEKVVVNENTAEQVTTIDIADSTPVATLQTTKTDSYTILNDLERGAVLTVTKQSGNALNLKWSPSYATPVIMRAENQNAFSDAYAFYAVGVNNDTAQSYTGQQGNPWYGVGAACRDFEDHAMYDFYNPKFDISAINADCALVGPQETISRGFEWCGETIHTGTLGLKSIFYTPQGSLSTISKTAFKSGMTFLGEGVNGGDIPLNGSTTLPGNSPGDELSSVEEILQLVEDEAICVRNTGAKTEFFWNPKEVLNAVKAQEKAVEAACIIK